MGTFQETHFILPETINWGSCEIRGRKPIAIAHTGTAGNRQPSERGAIILADVSYGAGSIPPIAVNLGFARSSPDG
jgi:hypothetical protein